MSGTLKLGYFTMSLHPVGRDWRQTLAEAVLPRINRALGEIGGS